MATVNFRFEWELADPAGAQDGEAATWGYLRVTVGSKPLWGAAEGSPAPGARWTWIELLEHLSSSWPWLVGEHGWPPNVLPVDMYPADFEVERRRALEDAGVQRKRIDATLFEFRERHDLSFAVRGKTVPRLWVVRQGYTAWLGSYMLPWSQVVTLLTNLGEAIVERLKPHMDSRSVSAVQQWATREDVDPMLRAEAVTGLDDKRLCAVADNADPIVALEIPGPGFESSELAFAARLAAPSLNIATVRKLLACIREAPLGIKSTKLSALTARALPQKFQSDYAYDEGWRLARWLRQELQIPADARVEPDDLLAEWQVMISQVDLGDPGVDAVACWGPKHGPAVYVNRSGRRAQEEAGRRATVAHEIAHLLVDCDRALPLSEIQGSVHRGRIERRANAFAAEFLMPQAIAGGAFSDCASSQGVLDVLEGLSKRFGASREIIAWQALRNSSVELSELVRRELAPCVPERRRWQFFVGA